MHNNQKTNRREFVKTTATLASAVGVSSVICQNTAATEKVNSTIQIEGRQTRKVVTNASGQLYVAVDNSVAIYNRQGTQLAKHDFTKPVRALHAFENGQMLVGFINSVALVNADGKTTKTVSAFDKASVLSEIAVHDEGIMISDSGTQVVWQLNSELEILGSIDLDSKVQTPASQLKIMVVKDQLHVVNSRRHRIDIYSLAGVKLGSWGKKSRDPAGFSGCCNPVGLAVTADGTFITAERSQPRIKQFDQKGQFIAQIMGPDAFPENAKASENDNGLGCNTGGFDLAVDTQGRVIVLDLATNRLHIVA
ncbi:MAG: hypothetical protein COA78_19490 [Blastopirellula sp.]|nr:MAG: hypothetical protein COA78_19490 [Blastopirellula sp.]